MIIPIRCFTCGKVIANKWNAYKEAVDALENAEIVKSKDDPEFIENFEKQMKGKILDDLLITRICCRRHMLTHIDLIDII